jgi:hypothetical protein
MFDKRFLQLNRPAFLIGKLDMKLDQFGQFRLAEAAQQRMLGRRQARFVGVLVI